MQRKKKDRAQIILWIGDLSVGIPRHNTKMNKTVKCNYIKNCGITERVREPKLSPV